jgi:hypothetical protein
MINVPAGQELAMSYHDHDQCSTRTEAQTRDLSYYAGEKPRVERAKNEQLFIPRATARRGHRGIRPMVYILKGKVSWLRL